MEAEEHTAEFALDTDGKFQVVKFVILIASRMFSEGKMRLDESIKQMGSPGRHSHLNHDICFSLNTPSFKDLVTKYQREIITYLDFRLYFTAACCPLRKHPLPY